MNKKLLELRKESGLTQKLLGERLHCSGKSIWAYEHGSAAPSNEVLIRYAKYFDVTTDYLLGLTDEFGVRNAEGNSVPPISREERKLLDKYRSLNDRGKELVRYTMDAWLNEQS